MIRKGDWARVHRGLLARQRAHLGPPPGDEELLAYAEGRMSPTEEERMQDLLACHPDLARLVADPLPAPSEAAGVLTSEEMAEDWAAIQDRLSAPLQAPSEVGGATFPPRGSGRPPALLRLAAIAATLVAVVLGALLHDAHGRLERQARALAEPRFVDRHLLLPDGQRGGGAQPPIEVVPAGDLLLLAPELTAAPSFSAYRLDIQDTSAGAPRQIWSASGLHRRGDDTFGVAVPRRFLPASDYRVVISGLGAGEPRVLATYSLHLPHR